MKTMWWRIGALVLVAGCSGSLAPHDGTDMALYSPCAEGTRVGSFTVSVKDSFVSSTGFGGRVADRPEKVISWQPVASEGACTRLDAVPEIACPSCTGADVCNPDGACAPLPVTRSAGTIRVDGFATLVSLEPKTASPTIYYQNESPLDPAPAPGAVITMTASGGDVGPFTLSGRGITPLVNDDSTQPITPGQPLMVTWNPPDPPAQTRLIVTLQFASNTAKHITCHFPDTGVGAVPASLLEPFVADPANAKIAHSISLERLTLTSTQSANGCVDFAVRSAGVYFAVIQD